MSTLPIRLRAWPFTFNQIHLFGAFGAQTELAPAIFSASRGAYDAWYRQCRINYGSGGSPEPGPLKSGGLIISQK